jgi:hypothetical protein
LGDFFRAIGKDEQNRGGIMQKIECTGDDVSFSIEQNAGACSFVGEFSADSFVSADGLNAYQVRNNAADGTRNIRRINCRQKQE